MAVLGSRLADLTTRDKSILLPLHSRRLAPSAGGPKATAVTTSVTGSITGSWRVDHLRSTTPGLTVSLPKDPGPPSSRPADDSRLGETRHHWLNPRGKP